MLVYLKFNFNLPIMHLFLCIFSVPYINNTLLISFIFLFTESFSPINAANSSEGIFTLPIITELFFFWGISYKNSTRKSLK